MQISGSGKHLPSPKSKLPPPLQIHPEESLKSPKRIFNGQSTESLESLSDELASNSGGNNTGSTNNRDAAVSRRVSFTDINSFSHERNWPPPPPHPLTLYQQFPSRQITPLISLYFQRHEFHRYKRCRALYDCEADNEDELSFEEGDIIVIVAEETEDDNWMEGVLESEPDRRGLFPASFVHMLSD